MAKLVRIKEVRLYVGLTEDAAKCFEMKKHLEEKGIKYLLMAYMDDSIHTELLEALSTWNWGAEGKKQLTSFPFVTWVNCFDDFELTNGIAQSIEEIDTKLLPHNDLVV